MEFEVYLYGCEICQSIVFLYQDCGRVHLQMCKSCNGGTFHNKIVLTTKWNIEHDKKELCPVFAIEEKEDDNSNTRADQEA